MSKPHKRAARPEQTKGADFDRKLNPEEHVDKVAEDASCHWHRRRGEQNLRR